MRIDLRKQPEGLELQLPYQFSRTPRNCCSCSYVTFRAVSG
jgi:hypothetical protein